MSTLDQNAVGETVEFLGEQCLQAGFDQVSMEERRVRARARCMAV